MLKVAVVGATGYTGIELIKLLWAHPRVRIAALTTRQKEPLAVRTLVPSLPKDADLEIRRYPLKELKRKADLFFVCLPHTQAADTVAELIKAGKTVIDLSADFRLRDTRAYEIWYTVKHRHPDLLKRAVYGLSEVYRSEIKKADLVANPGCYPTGVILALAPLLRRRLIDPRGITIDAKSGVSGAGKKLSPTTQYCEVEGNFFAYKVGRHQHTPEIEQVLADVAGRKIEVTFVPHLLPLERGILSTIYLRRKKDVDSATVKKAYETTYRNEPFVRVKEENTFPELHDVRYTNYCDIGFTCDRTSDRLIVVTALDNLLKGASGQAVQNMNIRCGFPEEEGLRR